LITLGDEGTGCSLADARDQGREPRNSGLLRAGEVAPDLLLRLHASECLKEGLAVKAGLRCDFGKDLLARDITVVRRPASSSGLAVPGRNPPILSRIGRALPKCCRMLSMVGAKPQHQEHIGSAM
jgi:hypothetical protein